MDNKTTSTAKQISWFLKQHGMNVYVEPVPEDTVLPYITYTAQVFNTLGQGLIQGKIWVKGTTSYDPAYDVVDSMDVMLGFRGIVVSGKQVPDTSGAVAITKGEPFFQHYVESKDPTNYRNIYFLLNFATLE
jgi:hypothetical protein